MTEAPQDQPADILSVEDVKHFLDWETTAVMKAAELRLRELQGLVAAYATGEVTPSQAMERFDQYQDRWGEALPGVWQVRGVADETILATIDGKPGGHAAAEQTRRRNRSSIRARRS